MSFQFELLVNVTHYPGKGDIQPPPANISNGYECLGHPT